MKDFLKTHCGNSSVARATLWLLCGKKPVGVVNIVVTVPGARKEAEAFPEVLWVAEFLGEIGNPLHVVIRYGKKLSLFCILSECRILRMTSRNSSSAQTRILNKA